MTRQTAAAGRARRPRPAGGDTAPAGRDDVLGRAAGRGGGPAGGGGSGRAGGRRGRRRRSPPHGRQPVLRSAGIVAAEGRAGGDPARRARGAGGEIRRPSHRVRGFPERRGRHRPAVPHGAGGGGNGAGPGTGGRGARRGRAGGRAHRDAPGAYQFRHDLFREYAYQRLSAAERARLHLRTGLQLEAGRGRRGGRAGRGSRRP
jgi:hypothetical protein